MKLIVATIWLLTLLTVIPVVATGKRMTLRFLSGSKI
ncbi:MAG: hypothetical protein ACI92S_002374 [Planctomycetaceae bacterium]|jgi:hypothetical protein